MMTNTSPLNSTSAGLLTQLSEIDHWWPDATQTVVPAINVHETHSHLEALRKLLVKDCEEGERDSSISGDFDEAEGLKTHGMRVSNGTRELLNDLDLVIRETPHVGSPIAEWVRAQQAFDQFSAHVREPCQIEATSIQYSIGAESVRCGQ